MALAPRIEIRQTQSLVMTPQLQQAIKLLQMSSIDLAGYLAAEVEKNPLLELGPAPTAPGVTGAIGRRADDDGDWLDGIAANVTLHQHLHTQIRPMRGTPRVIEAALLIADELEDDGYLRVPLAEVTARHGLRAADALAGLTLVQACDPSGVGARDLRECLSLQLRDQNRLDPAMQAMLDNLALAAKGNLVELERVCGVDAEDVADMLAEIRALDPKPGLRFAQTRVEVAVPDVYVSRAPDGTLNVELNAESLPRVLMNNVYATRIGKDDSEARAFVSECSTRASWLIRSLEQRARTILKVAIEIARRQDRFFDTGTPGLRPLTRRAVAEQLGLHESTVSRVTAGKYVACEHGCYEFSHLFVSAIQAVSGGEAYSSAAVQDRIRSLVEAEPARRTLSDDKLVTLLKGEGIDIARRTVAKYRESMGIPSSVERRRLRARPSATREIAAGAGRSRD
ncbi:MAG: RNA polymerase factor sigma-54 [Amaricoccus sp.]|uniref:RNA polymerase factor sigma-54 n=1 Tax=Amaricoccus sp. TaxID=1872485 RepID=UPI0039E33651